jgi:purine nucleosidase
VTGRPQPILFDTDIGSDVDDALALGLVLASRNEVDLVAVTTVGRHGGIRARIAAGLLGLGGRGDVETCIGAETPALPRHSFNWFDHEQACIPDAPPAPISDEPAAERIVRAAREVEGLEVVMIGPMTNLARALALDRELARRLGGITIMGGHLREVRIGERMAPYGIDYNLCADPEASMTVLGCGAKITLVPADITLRSWLREASVVRMESGGGAMARELARQIRIWAPVQEKIFTGFGGTLASDNRAFLHDPLTLLAWIDDASLGWEPVRVVPTIEGGVFRSWEVPAGEGPGIAMRAALSVDAARAESSILERILPT